MEEEEFSIFAIPLTDTLTFLALKAIVEAMVSTTN